MTPTHTLPLQSILDAARAATPGPWKVEGEAVPWKPRQKPFTDQGAGIDAGIDPKNGYPINVIVGGAQDEQGGAVGVLSNADAAYIALMSPDLTTALVERLMKAEAALTEISTLSNYARPEEKIGYAIDLARATLTGDSQ